MKDYHFGGAIDMTSNGLAMVVAASNANFGGIGSGSVYLFVRYTRNDPFEQVSRVDGQCVYERLGYNGVAIEVRDDTFLVHAKANYGKCVDYINNIRTYHVSTNHSIPFVVSLTRTTTLPNIRCIEILTIHLLFQLFLTTRKSNIPDL
mmetsp:Transcript_8007/g.10039  ORF Transcript_8007/g.10039 Transcript_8007/m.10039 type:complete len:148 (-) Transcript_8007:559-1002(-)